MTLDERIRMRYPKGVSYPDLMKSEEIRSYLPPGYLPIIIESDGCLFLQPESYVTTSTISEKAFYVYMNKLGHIRNDPELSLVQMGLKYEGFIARLSFPTTSQIPSQLKMDYVIDLENIKFISSKGMRQTDEGVETTEGLVFDTIDPKLYPKASFPETITDFQMRKEDLYNYLTGK